MNTCDRDWLTENAAVQNALIRIVHRYFTIIFHQIIKYGVHPGQISVLMLLMKKEGLSQSEIGKELHIKPSTVAVSMKRMEKSGLICRKPDENDQRILRIYCTEKLKKIHEELHRLILDNEKVLMDGFTESEICLLNRFTDQIYMNLDKIPVPDLKQMSDLEEEPEHV